MSDEEFGTCSDLHDGEDNPMAEAICWRCSRMLCEKHVPLHLCLLIVESERLAKEKNHENV